MASTTEIANLALSHIGVSRDISNLDSESSNEARACRRFFDITRDLVLRDFAWPFAKRTAVLALVTDDPTRNWEYAYRYPSDCISILRIGDRLTFDNAQSRVPYEIRGDDTGSLILCNLAGATLEYTAQVSNTQAYPSDFTAALALRLATQIAPRLTAGDPFKIADRVMQLYLLQLGRAQTNAANEDQIGPLPESEMIRARD